MGILARTPGTRPVPLATLIVALVALVIPTLGVLANAEFAAWQSGHGHVGGAAAVAHHSHPYEDRTNESGGVASDIVFTPSDDGSVALALIPARALLELMFVAGGRVHASALDRAVAPGGTQPSVPVPPPRA